ncbi:MAG: UDP-N-acetylmuramoyl-L-alanine--D-glutamate ligase [Candidatus Krumholzibacteria bacterium]
MPVKDEKTFFVLGLGKSGLAVARLLARKGSNVVVYDEDDGVVGGLRRGKDFGAGVERIDIASAGDARQKLLQCDTLVVSPGVPLQHPLVMLARDNGVGITGELEVAYSFCSMGILGVTGTNGKSTVVSMLGNILKTAGRSCTVAGNIGLPLSDVVVGGEVFDTVVLEISSFQLDTITDFRADVAVLLNVTEDHLDRYNDSLDEYAASKSRILNRSDDETFFVYNYEDHVCEKIAGDFHGRKMAFSSNTVLDEGVFARQGAIVRSWEGQVENIIPIKEFSPVGIHNLENAMAAVAAVTPYEVETRHINESLKAYRPLPHRMELTRVVGGVAYINDSKATNVDAAIKSVRSIEGSVVLIMGGLDKSSDFRPMLDQLSRVKQVVLIGDAAEKIQSVIGGHCEVGQANTMEEAVGKASKKATAGDTVLLAPACASFDMFKNYEDRGNAFRDAVNRL